MRNTHKSHITIIAEDNATYSLLIKTWTMKEHSMLVDKQAFDDWANGQLIQRCFPDFDLDIRELMISGMDLDTQEIMFAPPDLEES
jgi:hypothetical protein